MPLRESAPVGAPVWVDLFTSDPDKSRPSTPSSSAGSRRSRTPSSAATSTSPRTTCSIAGGMRNDGDAGTPDLWSVYLAVANAQATVDAATPRTAAQVDVARDGGRRPRHDGGRHRPGRRAHRPLAARPAQGLRHRRRAGRAGVVRAAHAARTTRRSRSTATCSAGTPHARATRPSSATRRSAKATARSRASWTPRPSCPEASRSGWSVYFGADDTDKSLWRRIVELGGAVVRARARTRRTAGLAAAADPTGARVQAHGPAADSVAVPSSGPVYRARSVRA